MVKYKWPLCYNGYHNVREKFAGGVAIFAHTSLNCDTILSENFLENSHCLILKLLDFKINIGALYRAPDSRINDFLDYFSNLLNKYKNIIYLDDFNINVLNERTKDSENFNNLIQSEAFILLNKISVDMATRVTQTSASIIDLAITDLIKLSYNLFIDNIDFSDHRFIFLNFNTPLQNNLFAHKESITKINYHRIKIDISTNIELKFLWR